MPKDIILVGDAISYGGVVTTGSETDTIHGPLMNGFAEVQP